MISRTTATTMTTPKRAPAIQLEQRPPRLAFTFLLVPLPFLRHYTTRPQLGWKVSLAEDCRENCGLSLRNLGFPWFSLGRMPETTKLTFLPLPRLFLLSIVFVSNWVPHSLGHATPFLYVSVTSDNSMREQRVSTTTRVSSPYHSQPQLGYKGGLYRGNHKGGHLCPPSS